MDNTAACRTTVHKKASQPEMECKRKQQWTDVSRVRFIGARETNLRCATAAAVAPIIPSTLRSRPGYVLCCVVIAVSLSLLLFPLGSVKALGVSDVS